MISYLQIDKLTKSFGDLVLFEDITFGIAQGQKVGLIAKNGTGKTTLLNIIAGKEDYDSGAVVFRNDLRVGYLEQMPHYPDGLTVLQACFYSPNETVRLIAEYEQAMASGDHSNLEDILLRMDNLKAWDYEQRTKQILGQLKIHNFDQKMETLSGGQLKRVALANVLITDPELIILDEPTNHLDLEMTEWLEGYLSRANISILMVTHDRYFLDRVVTKVVEIFQHKAYVYQGNYSDFAKKKAKVREDLLKQYYNQQREIRHQEEVITKLKSFNREKSIKRAESREKALDKIERIEKPIDEKTDMHITLEPEITSGNDVLSVKGLSKSYEHKLFSNIDFQIKRGEKVALIGNNGTGKTTILKIINGIVDADAGEIKLGSNVEIGYYDQEHQNLDPDKTLFDEIADAYPNLKATKIRNVLAAFLFTDDDVFKRIRDISGGERGRVSLAKLMLSNANFLILDEPTNHLDIMSKEILESAINSYTGTVLYVSHDRYFINKTASRILDLKNETILNYIGNYDYYLEKKEVQELAAFGTATQDRADNSAAKGNVIVSDGTGEKNGTEQISGGGKQKLSWEEMKKQQAAKRKLENELKRTEDEIAKREAKIEALNDELSKPEVASNSYELNKIHEEQMQEEAALEELYAKWEELSLQKDC